MTSSRIILALLGLIVLVMVILSSGRMMDALRQRLGLLPKTNQVKDSQITATPTKAATDKDAEKAETVSFDGKEIPQTGPLEFVYLLLGGGLLAGFAIKKISRKIYS